MSRLSGRWRYTWRRRTASSTRAFSTDRSHFGQPHPPPGLSPLCPPESIIKYTTRQGIHRLVGGEATTRTLLLTESSNWSPVGYS